VFIAIPVYEKAEQHKLSVIWAAVAGLLNQLHKLAVAGIEWTKRRLTANQADLSDQSTQPAVCCVPRVSAATCSQCKSGSADFPRRHPAIPGKAAHGGMDAIDRAPLIFWHAGPLILEAIEVVAPG
jgi:hypothetical protein